MSGRVVVVMGVSGSGKTTVGRALAARLGWTFREGDELHAPADVAKMARGVPLTDADRAPWLRAIRRVLDDDVARGLDVVLACSALRRAHRDVLRGARGDVRFAYLRGTYDQIDRRVRARRGHFMPESLLRSQFGTLEAPRADEALAVDVEQPVAAIVDAIVRGLGQSGA
jgi:gluconokinase